MHNGKVLNKKLDDALFGFWLIKKYSEKTPEDSLADRLCREYREKCVALIDECGESCDQNIETEYIWQKTDFL